MPPFSRAGGILGTGRRAAGLLVLTALLAGPALQAAPPPRSKKRWIAAWVALAAVNALDVHSSAGRREANPLLRDRHGRFHPGKAVLLKSALTGGFFFAQVWTLRARPGRDYYPPFTLANTVAAAGLAGVAARNYSLGSRLPAPASATAHSAR